MFNKLGRHSAMMLKYLFALALLPPIVFCRFNSAERQGIEIRADGPKVFNCTRECETTCNCECQPGQCKKCQPGENFCKKVPYPGHESCPEEFWDDVCVPGNCECKYDAIENVAYKSGIL